MEPFKILDLPLIALTEFLRVMPLPHLVDLSFTNKRMHRLIRMSRFPNYTLNISISNDCVNITMNHPATGHWVIQSCANDEYQPYSYTVRIGDITAYVIKDQYYDVPVVKMSADSHIELGRQFMLYMLDLMPNIRIQMEFFKLSDQVMNLLIHDNVFSRFRDIDVEQSAIDNSSMTTMLSTVNINASLKIDQDIAKEVNAPVIKMRTFTTDSYYGWFNRTHLLNSNCEHLEITKTKCTGKDISDFVQQWLDGFHSRYRYLSIGAKDMDGFDFAKFKEREKFRRTMKFTSSNKTVDCTGGRDVTRPDGTTATILVKPPHPSRQRTAPFIFHFMVWTMEENAIIRRSY